MSQFPQELKITAQSIRLLVLDVDGVMTDGNLYFTNQGEEFKAFNTLDGQGIKLLQACGVEVAIITGRSSRLVQHRADNLGIRHLIQGREDKAIALAELMKNTQMNYHEIAFLGDDLPDLACIQLVGLGLAVANAHEIVKQHASYTTQLAGGYGAVREICDCILKAQDKYENAVAAYFANQE